MPEPPSRGDSQSQQPGVFVLELAGARCVSTGGRAWSSIRKSALEPSWHPAHSVLCPGSLTVMTL